jgi:hypothetical protein
MTVNEQIDSQSFAYDPQFPPDVAAGLPLSAAARPPRDSRAALKRAVQACTRPFARKR